GRRTNPPAGIGFTAAPRAGCVKISTPPASSGENISSKPLYAWVKTGCGPSRPDGSTLPSEAAALGRPSTWVEVSEGPAPTVIRSTTGAPASSGTTNCAVVGSGYGWLSRDGVSGPAQMSLVALSSGFAMPVPAMPTMSTAPAEPRNTTSLLLLITA